MGVVMQVTSMKLFHVVLILVGGLALSTPSSAMGVIRGSNAEDSKIGKTELSKVIVKHPASMGNSRGKLFQKQSAMPKYSVSRKSSGASVKIVRSSGKKSTVSLRKFPVVKVTSSTAR